MATTQADIEVPSDWYRSGFPAETTIQMPWADRTTAEVDRALGMLKPEGSERILDLACGIGRHSLELRRRGFEVVGLDISEELLEIARREAEAQSLEVSFMQADLRELDLTEEFDLVLSLNDGAVGYFETD
ncbi:MAG TPA: class I SAM-dependent methyltransferase, partial [Solirubrobacterales bacterium]